MPRKPFLSMGPIKKIINSSNPNALSWAIGAYVTENMKNYMVMIGKCVTCWPCIEAEIAELLSAILQCNTEASIAVFLKVRRSTTRNDALIAAGEKTLDFAGISILKQILRIVTSIETERNNIAHGYWGYCQNLPKHILWVHDSNVVFYRIELNAKVLNSTQAMTGEEYKNLHDKIFAYDIKDFKDLYHNMKELIDILIIFRSYVASFFGNVGYFSTQTIHDQLNEIALFRSFQLPKDQHVPDQNAPKPPPKRKRSPSLRKRRPVGS